MTSLSLAVMALGLGLMWTGLENIRRLIPNRDATPMTLRDALFGAIAGEDPSPPSFPSIEESRALSREMYGSIPPTATVAGGVPQPTIPRPNH